MHFLESGMASFFGTSEQIYTNHNGRIWVSSFDASVSFETFIFCFNSPLLNCIQLKAALERGWIPNGNLNSERIRTACAREDNGEFKCILKRGQLEQKVKDAVTYILQKEGLDNSTSKQQIMSMSGSELEHAAGDLLQDYFENNRLTGVTCDFGGIGMLVEENRTITYEDPHSNQADEYATITGGPALWIMIVAGIGIAAVAGGLGFVVAMRNSTWFNQRVRSHPILLPLTKTTHPLIRSTLHLPSLNYEEVLNETIPLNDKD
jgi:hypothetical protein